MTEVMHTTRSERGGSTTRQVNPAAYPQRVVGPRIRLGAGVEVLSSPGLHLSSLRRKAKEDPEGYAHLIRDLHKRRISWSRAKRSGYAVDDDDAAGFSFAETRDIKGMHAALESIDVRVTDAASQRAVTTAAFPLLVNGLTVAGITEAYEDVPAVGDMLVRDRQDNKAMSVFVGIVTDPKADYRRTDETAEYTQIGAGEERFLIEHFEQGLQVVIPQRLIDENDVAGVEDRITAVGRIGRELQEEQILERVTDNSGSAAVPANPFVLHGPLANAGRALFVTSNAAPLTRLPATGNRITNNSLQDESDLETARLRIAAMTNSRGRRILFPGVPTLLVPAALATRAFKILNSQLTPGVLNEANPFGPGGLFAGTRLLHTPKLDDLSGTAWYYGYPQFLFVRKWKLAPEISTHSGTGTEAYTRTREAVRVRLAWDMEIGVTDYVGWLQNLSATTPPARV